ncbi:MAG: amidohydrolase [Candidatus Eremiobacteraeota bacterium]|nr:amidohydrolase [Candidatus Eremiobacteraeota bacterium]
MHAAPSVAEIILTNADVVTMDDARPGADAIAIVGGRILAVGNAGDVRALANEATRVVDLGGKTVMPGFIDGHSHFFQVALVASSANVSAPPVGRVSTIAEIVTALKEFAAQHPLEPGAWLLGFGYDGSALRDGREATRDDLDAAFPDTPVLLVHVSAHGCLLNSAALKIVGINANTPTPEGGVIARRPGTTEPTGLVMETAWLHVLGFVPRPTPQQALASIAAAQASYAANGYTTAQDAPAIPPVMKLYETAAAQRLLSIDLVAYADAGGLAERISGGLRFPTVYSNRLKIGGVKLILDGSPQGKTAFFTQPYLTDGPNGEKDYRGAPVITAEELQRTVDLAYAHGAQVLAHCNGDGAIDMMLEAHRTAGAPAGRRTTIVHSQFVRRDQLDRYVEYGMVASFFTNHAYFWGDVHVKNLGKERAYFLSPMKTAGALGIRMSDHSDFFVTPLNPLFIAWTAVNRISRSGEIIGPEERVSAHAAFRALTIDAAYQYGEEERKGSIAAGKLADLVVLDRNPLKVDASQIKDVRVVQTFKEGRPVYPSELSGV